LLHSKTVSLHGLHNLRDLWLSCLPEINVRQWHSTTSSWNCDVWLHNKLLHLTSHVCTRSHDFHGCHVRLTLTFWMSLVLAHNVRAV